MGYTHYWSWNKARPNTEKVEKNYQYAVLKCQKLIKAYNAELKAQDLKHPDRLSGATAHCRIGQYGGLEINGTQELGHETFSIREHYNQNNSDFCKTAYKPYDVVVVACLIILKYYLKSLINVSSDGRVSEWDDGLELAKRLTGLKSLKVPGSIEKDKLRIVS